VKNQERREGEGGGYSLPFTQHAEMGVVVVVVVVVVVRR